MTTADAPASPWALCGRGGDVLRSGFQRDGAPDAMAKLQKLARGRVQHALTGRRVLEYVQPSANASGPCPR